VTPVMRSDCDIDIILNYIICGWFSTASLT
jgi:hypothetical protein